MHIGVLAFDGFDTLDATGPFGVFGTARALGADVDLACYAPEDRPAVTSSHGLRVEPDGALPSGEAGDDPPDVVVVPGGGWSDRPAAGAWAEAERGLLPEALVDLHEAGSTLASVCTGGMLLARAGLLDGRPAVTHRDALDDLRGAGAEVVEARVVDDGDVVTAGGVSAGLDLACHLVRRDFGDDLARRVCLEMEYEPRGAVHVADRSGTA